MRKYSVDEIDDMRRNLGRMYPLSGVYQASERAADVENRLRTHMQNGTEPADLQNAADEFMRREIAHQKVLQQVYRDRGVFRASRRV